MNMTTIRSRWNTWPFVPCRDLLFLDKVKNVVIEIRGFSLSFNSISLSFFGVNRYSGNNRCDRICLEKFEFFSVLQPYTSNNSEYNHSTDRF